MELPGSAYLDALASVSITFVGFSAILLMLRQAATGSAARYETYFMLSFIQSGFAVTAGALLPQLLAFYGLEPSLVWRASSGAMAVPFCLFVVTLPRRRRAVSRGPFPVYVWVLLGLQLAIVVYLLVNGLGLAGQPRIAPYAAALTGFLFTSGIAYLQALSGALGAPDGRR